MRRNSRKSFNSTRGVFTPARRAGQHLEITFEEELFRISREGQIERLTFLTDAFEAVEISSSSLSPDNNKVAFNFTTGPERMTYRLVVLDLVTRKLNIFISIKLNRFRDYMQYIAPAWSPDSVQIMLVDSYEEEKFRAILADLDEEFAVEIAKDMIPAGWIFDDNSDSWDKNYKSVAISFQEAGLVYL